MAIPIRPAATPARTTTDHHRASFGDCPPRSGAVELAAQRPNANWRLPRMHPTAGRHISTLTRAGESR